MRFKVGKRGGDEEFEYILLNSGVDGSRRLPLLSAAVEEATMLQQKTFIANFIKI